MKDFKIGDIVKHKSVMPKGFKMVVISIDEEEPAIECEYYDKEENKFVSKDFLPSSLIKSTIQA